MNDNWLEHVEIEHMQTPLDTKQQIREGLRKGSIPSITLLLFDEKQR